MFACLHSTSAPQSLLVKVAEDFTPRYQIVDPLVILDLTGLSRLFGSPREIGEQLRRSMGGAPVRIAIAPSQTAAALLALGKPGLTVVSIEEQPAALAGLPVGLLGELEQLRQPPEPRRGRAEARTTLPKKSGPPHVGETSPKRPDGREGGNCGGGWRHPRDSHAANAAKRAQHEPIARAAHVTPCTLHVARLDTLRRWGIKTLGALAVLPAGDVYERLGARGIAWQRFARGEDYGPMVPCVPEDPFEGALDLEWPIEGLEPLSFILARLFEPLAEQLERADRGAAILHTHLRLTTHEVYTRTIQLPTSMRDPKTLRTLVLLDLESNPPSAAIDRVRVLIEPTPARVLQWTLYERAQPSPEQVSTLLARLTALMGEGHVGSPRLLNSWKPGAFDMTTFNMPSTEPRAPSAPGKPDAPGTALRRFRLPIPARVQMQDGRPMRVMVDRRGVRGGVVEQSAGPWRTSGEWWNDGQVGQIGHPPQSWDRDEWDVLLKDGPVYRLFVERPVGQWFIEGTVD